MRYKAYTPYLFLLPTLLGLVLFSLGPTVVSFLLSFTEWRGTVLPQFIGLGNYQELMRSRIFWQVVRNTLVYVAIYTPATVILGLGLALLVNQKLKYIAFFRGIYYLPAITSTVAVALVWNWIFASRYGLINYLLRTLGSSRPPNWLADRDTALYVLIIVSVWKSAGLPMMVFLAGLQGIPKNLYEAARVDGATRWQKFWYVTLPMLTPITFFVLIVTLFDAFGTFEVTFAMTQGGPLNASTTLPYYVYQNAFEFFRYGFSSAAAYLLLLITLILTFINFRLRSRWVHTNT
jgi:ABC-type sugar transport system permease subunit